VVAWDHLPSTRALIHAPWSASKVATALRCPRLFHFKYVDKVAELEVMPEARIGKAVHKALEWALGGLPTTEAATKARAELKEEVDQLRFDRLAESVAPFLTRIGRFRRQRRVTRQLVEYSLAIRDDLTATSFYSGDAYYRGILDAGYLFNDSAIALVDHKTGVRAPGSTIADQLGGYAVLAAATFRAEATWLGVHWVANRAVEWSAPLSATAVNETLIPELLDNIEAAALAVDDGPRTNPGPWCDRCAYRSICPASREQRYEPVEYYEEDDE
jgi:hypothetical protein